MLEVLIGIGGLIVGGAIVVLLMGARVTTLTGDRAALEAELKATRRAADDQKGLLLQSQTQLREAFAALSQEALRENRQDFLQNADALLAPVRQTLDKVQTRLVDVDKEREGSYRAVTAQLGDLATAHRELRDAAEGLSRSLRSPNVRGKWGELQLRRIVELAGMTAHCDFVEKPTVEAEDGSRLTPDMIVTLPGNMTIVVNAKVPIDGYLAASEAKTDVERDAKLVTHVRQVRDHIRALAAKEYWRQFPASPDFVVMFLPIEPLLGAALDRDGTLLDQAAALHVIPATPLTLLALLKTVALGWRQEQVARNAEEIQEIGQELYDRLKTMTAHLEAVGRNIKQAGDAYDRLIGSVEQKVLPGARRFRELGVHATEDLETGDALRLSLRSVTRPELLELTEAEAPTESQSSASPAPESRLRQA